MVELPRTAALPAGARLLHIGLPKTGTTAVQSAASSQRRRLRGHGVCYPGQGTNHLYPVCGLMGRRVGWSATGFSVVDRRWWTDLIEELDRFAAEHPGGRALVSHEFASESDEQQARRFVAELGPETRVVITLRSFASLLGSSWQQYVKAGRKRAFVPWLREVLAERPRSPAARGFYRRNDQALILDRWMAAAGADRVVVVVGDRRRPTLLTDAFADLLGVPRGLLAGGAESGENRSMSWPEAELLRLVNKTLHAERLDWRTYEMVVRNGMVARMLSRRRPAPGEPGMVLPDWAAERAAVIARRYADHVIASGCRVVGDPEQLSAPGPVGTLNEADRVPMDAAVEAALGLLSASLGRGGFFDVEERPLPPELRRLLGLRRGRRWLELNEANPTATASDLAAVAAIRAARQLRRRLRR